MPTPTLLDREFLQVRCYLLDLAAALDRVDRDPQAQGHDPRRELIRSAIERLLGEDTDRTEAVQQLFSLPYQDHWRTTFEV